MKLITFVFQLALLAAALLIAGATATTPTTDLLSIRSDIPHDLPHPVVLMHFNDTFGGVHVELNGTVQQIFAEAAKDPLFVMPDGAALSEATLIRRSKFQLLCMPIASQPWRHAKLNAIRDGIAYLNKLNRMCGVAARSCARISCSYGSAIYVCNDNDYYIEPNCGYLGSYAQDMVDNKACLMWQGKIWWVGGQEFDTDSYNVIVREDYSLDAEWWYRFMRI